MDKIEIISNNIPQEVIEDAGKSNLSKNEIFNIINKVNRLNKPKDINYSNYINTNLLKYDKYDSRY